MKEVSERNVVRLVNNGEKVYSTTETFVFEARVSLDVIIDQRVGVYKMNVNPYRERELLDGDVEYHAEWIKLLGDEPLIYDEEMNDVYTPVLYDGEIITAKVLYAQRDGESFDIWAYAKKIVEAIKNSKQYRAIYKPRYYIEEE